MILTVDSILALEPCREWPRERITAALELYGGEVDLLVALRPHRAHALTVEDRTWLGLACLDARAQRHLACDFATRALRRGREPDPRSWEAVRVGRVYADGNATDTELRAARGAALDAARDGEWGYAALAAEWAAAEWATEWDAALVAALAAAEAAARAAALDARGAERKWQLRRIIEAHQGQLLWQKGTQQ